jgi:hypothetical protein
LPPNSFAFGVFGDGPYYVWEEGPFERLIADVNSADLAWFLHVGDILNGDCADAAYEKRLLQFNGIQHPVVYTPGDNEWTDCHTEGGGYDPLDRLARLRQVYFGEPGQSLGGSRMNLTSQAADTAFTDFPEHGRWTYGGFVFATFHLVGSDNGLETFPGRTVDSDAEVERRTAAATAWLDATFTQAVAESASGVVLATHANVGLAPQDSRRGYYGFVQALERHVAAFRRPILLIHGDTHTYRVDHPMVGPDGAPWEHVTRLETLGSPTIGWVRVVVDTVTGSFTDFEPRRMRGWW